MSTSPALSTAAADLPALARAIKAWGADLGFADVRIADVDLGHLEAGLQAWLDAGYHGEMDYMASHGMKRARPAELVPGTVRAIVARMDYLPPSGEGDWRARERLRQQDPEAAVVSVYARGRDYHKVLRNRLASLAARIQDAIGPFGFRVFTDSAPVMELPLAEKAGLGWRGKHTLLLSRAAGSTFFIGEILVDLPLPVDPPTGRHCGQCQACIDLCPTGAILAPGKLDARRCISYLTIELKSSIPEELRPLIGNRIYGCDDCLAACPWNKFAASASEMKLKAREDLKEPSIAFLLTLDDPAFRTFFSGSPVKRIGRDRFVRNVLIAAGNSGDRSFVDQCRRLSVDASPTVRGMAIWALKRLMSEAEFAMFAAARAPDDDAEVENEWTMAGVV